MESILNYVKGIMFLLILITFVLNALPDLSYKKYLKVFMGLVLVITILKPVTGFLGVDDTFYNEFSKYSDQFDSDVFGKKIGDLQNEIVEEYVSENNTEIETEEDADDEESKTEADDNDSTEGAVTDDGNIIEKKVEAGDNNISDIYISIEEIGNE